LEGSGVFYFLKGFLKGSGLVDCVGFGGGGGFFSGFGGFGVFFGLFFWQWAVMLGMGLVFRLGGCFGSWFFFAVGLVGIVAWLLGRGFFKG
jgi:hypothetical protein